VSRGDERATLDRACIHGEDVRPTVIAVSRRPDRGVPLGTRTNFLGPHPRRVGDAADRARRIGRPETLTINGITYTADDSAVGAGATATAYDGSQGTAVVIPAKVTTLGWPALGTSPFLASVKFLGSAPTTIGTSPLGTTSTPSGPLVLYYACNSGFATPTWGSFGGYSYMSQALATVIFDANGHGTAPAATGSNLAATGSNDTLPLGALAFLLVGAGAAITMRLRRSA